MVNLIQVLWPKKANNDSLLSLPPEIRLYIYGYILPPFAKRSEYIGLIRSCRLIRREFTCEAAKRFKPQYERLRRTLRENCIFIDSYPDHILRRSTLGLSIPIPATRTIITLPKELIPVHWHSLSKVVITLQAALGPERDEDDLWLRGFWQKVDALMNEETIETGNGVKQLKKPLEIKEIVLRWRFLTPRNRNAISQESSPGTHGQLNRNVREEKVWKVERRAYRSVKWRLHNKNHAVKSVAKPSAKSLRYSGIALLFYVLGHINIWLCSLSILTFSQALAFGLWILTVIHLLGKHQKAR